MCQYLFYMFNTSERNKNENKVIKTNLLYKQFYRDVNSTKKWIM